MRAKRITQASIFEPERDSHIGTVLERVSEIIDAHPHWLDWIEADLGPKVQGYVGREGLSIETILRCLIAKQFLQVSYRRLAFMLSDSLAFLQFARLTPHGKAPSKSALHATLSAIDAGTLARMNVDLVAMARKTGFEAGKKVRIDSTVTHTDILTPMDNNLLRDAVRVLVRLMRRGREVLGTACPPFTDHLKSAKRRALAASKRRGVARKQAYGELIRRVERSLEYLDRMVPLMTACGDVRAERWCAEVAHYRALITQVIDQTRRRAIEGEQVPAGEKVVSLFEPHTDIIVKKSRDVQYGHKVNLSTGVSGLVLDVVVESGNPADSERFIPMLERHIERHGVVPKQVAADGGYASTENLRSARELGVRDVVFHKKRGWRWKTWPAVGASITNYGGFGRGWKPGSRI